MEAGVREARGVAAAFAGPLFAFAGTALLLRSLSFLLLAASVLSGPALALLLCPVRFPIWAQAAGLGSVFLLALYCLILQLLPIPFTLYVAFFCFFHWSEFMGTALWSPGNLKVSSFLLDHSREYWIAALVSWTEFWLTYALFPGVKECWWAVLAGVLLCIGGEAIRLGAMRTAGRSFSHIVQEEKGKEQRLVREGLYAWVRHPAYTGWFMWSVGTQVVLVNPLCMVAYSIVVWRFFSERIEYEEYTLIHHMFGSKYVEYQAEVHSGIPFVSGYRPEEDDDSDERNQ